MTLQGKYDTVQYSTKCDRGIEYPARVTDDKMQGRWVAPVPVAAFTRLGGRWLLATGAVFPFLVISRSGAAG